MEWNEALELLKEGNQRFVNKKLDNHVYTEKEMDALGEGQEPYAVVFCCSDSRVSPDILFDETLGNLFIISNAGNIVSENVFASIEYPIKNLGSKLVVVMGHSDCGAVTAAYEDAELDGYLKPSIGHIKEAIKDSKSLDEAIIDNTEYMANEIRKVIQEQGLDAKVITSHETLETGEVIFNI